ncbi:MAG: aldo/keto reductase [Erysipelotrichaceae bacterium]|jgi:predicted oxidoreductase|nr:aldo/keto reductase [Erysipelotrichaceae bacterium]
MKTIQLGTSGLKVPTIAIGCMRLNGLSESEAEVFLRTAIDLGANFFDHADIYGKGECEKLFAKAIGMNSAVREKIILQSKCGIRSGIGYDFSKEYILESVDGILDRLNTDYLDVLLLHRPDALMEPQEVAEAFAALHQSGKVRHFGVSNHSPLQIQLLQKAVKQPLIVNQLQLSIAHASMITQGLHVNVDDEGALSRDGGVLDFCRLNDITIQPWSPFQYGFFQGTFLGSDKYPKLNEVLDTIAAKYQSTNTAIALAWLLRHPAKFQPVIGTTNRQRLKECVSAADLYLTREEWYRIYKAAGNTLP